MCLSTAQLIRMAALPDEYLATAAKAEILQRVDENIQEIKKIIKTINLLLRIPDVSDLYDCDAWNYEIKELQLTMLREPEEDPTWYSERDRL